MGDCFSCQHRRLPGTKDKETEKPQDAPNSGDLPAAPASAEASELRCGSPMYDVTSVPESVPETALPLDALEKQLQDLKKLQCQYLQGQLRVHRTCQNFPRSLRAISLQICHAQRRLIRIEVRLKRLQREAPPSSAGPPQVPSVEGLRPVSASSLTHEPISPIASDSRGVIAIGSRLSTFSLPLPPFPPPPPVQPDLRNLHEALATLLEQQAHHLQDRKRDIRSCQECLRSIKALRAQLRKVRHRLWILEAKLGIQVPPRELDADEREEEKEELELPLPAALDTSRKEQDTRTFDLDGQS